VVAAVPAAVVTSIVAAIAGWPSPLEAVAEQIMEWTPLPLAQFLLFHLSGAARPLALFGALAATMVMAGCAGALYGASGTKLLYRAAGFVGAALWLGATFLRLFAPSRPEPAIVLIVFILLVLLAQTALPPVQSDRRSWLIQNGMIVGGAAILVGLFSVRPLLRALSTSRLFTYRKPAGLPVAGLANLVTSPAHHYVMDKVLADPEIGPPSWSLVVDGQVRTPLNMDYGKILQAPQRSRYITLECVDNPVGGPLMSNALWTGIPIGGLLDSAGIRGETVVFHGADAYAEAVPYSVLKQSGALLAYGINGERLPTAHGYPLRLVLPGVYGFKSVKWLTHIQVIRGVFAGNWRTHGWTDVGTVQTTVRIDVARRQGNVLLVAGFAFAGSRGISAVEVRVDDGQWRRATLGLALSQDAWVQWAVRFVGVAGTQIQARAIDGRGQVQPGEKRDSYPNGATGWHTISV